MYFEHFGMLLPRRFSCLRTAMISRQKPSLFLLGSEDYAYNAEIDTSTANEKADLAEARQLLSSIRQLFRLKCHFRGRSQVEMENAESWEDYELQLVCRSIETCNIYSLERS